MTLIIDCKLIVCGEKTAINTGETQVGVRLWKQRQLLWDMAENQRLENLWTFGILTNVLILTIDHYPASETWSSVAESMNMACLLLFTVEVLIKVGGYGLSGFVQDPWHRLDLFVM